MNVHDMVIPDIKALVAYGRVGIEMMASRMLSLISLLGTLALAGYVAYSPTNAGLAAVAIVAIFAFMPALKAETGQRHEAADKE